MMCSPFRYIVAFFGLVLLLGPFTVGLQQAQAQEAALRGVVTSSNDGTVLPNANVVLSTIDGERVAATATNLDGLYELRNLDPGRYRIRFLYVGYETHRDTLSLEPGRRRYDASLAPTEKTLEEVTVEAERGAAQREAGLQTVRVADLERVPSPGPGGDLAAYVQTLPGVVSVGDRGGELYIRGGSSSQNLVLVDGLRVIKPFHISNLFSAFPQEGIESAEIYAGGFGAEYMGGISSVIDVSLRQGNMKEFQGSVSLSPFLVEGRVEGPIRKGQDSFLAITRYSTMREAGPAIYGREIPLRFYDATMRYSFQGDNSSCNVTGLRTHDRGEINPSRNLVLSWSNTAVGGRCLFFGESLDQAIDLRGGYTQFRNAAGTRASPQRTASLNKAYVGIQTDTELLGNAVNYGGRWVATNYRYNLHERFTDLQQADQAGGAIQFHASMDFTQGEWLTVSPSVGTHLTVRRLGSPTLEPRLRLTIRPTGSDRQEISIAAGKYNQVAENLTDERDAGTVFTVWRPSEKNEPLIQALHGIVGYRQRVDSWLTLNVEGFTKGLSNIPVPKWSPMARFDVETALADGVAYGADFRAEIEEDPFYLFLGYGWSRVIYSAARDNLGAWVEGEVVEYPPPHDRRHQLNVVSSYDIGRFSVNASWEFGSGRPYTKVSGFDLALDVREQSATPTSYPTTTSGTAEVFYERPYDARLPTYHQFDLSVERSFDLSSALSMTGQVGAINVYDRQNIFYYDIETFERVDQTPVLPYISVSVTTQ